MYAVAPFIGWFVAGVLKFIINQIRFGNGKGLIGNGGFPSNHTTIMTTATTVIGLQEGFNTPFFGLGIAITFIVIIDALGLRRHVGRHAAYLNELSTGEKLRERMGHTPFEVLGGLVVGTITGSCIVYVATHFFS
jgi:uncharacterized protein